MTRKVKPEEKPTRTPLVKEIERKCSTCFYFYESATHAICEFPLPEWLTNMFFKGIIVSPYGGVYCPCWKGK